MVRVKNNNKWNRFWGALSLLIALLIFTPQVWAQEEVPQSEQTVAQQEEDTKNQFIESLLSMSGALQGRYNQLEILNTNLEMEDEEAAKAALQIEIEALSKEILQVEEEIDLVVLGLQSQQYSKDGAEAAQVDIKKEIGRVFEPIVISLERATEPARRMEELRQLLEQVNTRKDIAAATLEHLSVYSAADATYPEKVQDRLDKYQSLWASRLQEAEDLAGALDEQLQAAQRARGSTWQKFGKDIGGFLVDRGTSLILALGLGVGFMILCQILRIFVAKFYRRRNEGVLSAGLRVFSLIVSVIGVLGGFVIAITVFNMRHDWLLLAMGLLLAVAVSWTFIRSLASLMEQSRVLLNLGAVREGERTIVNGLPYKIERLGVYSKFVNPDLSGGALIYPVRELIGMHSRPVTKGEKWFPTEEGDWIVRAGRHYEVMHQTPEHVILRRPGGSEDFVPVDEFLGTEFELISNGFRTTYGFGLAYGHLADANEKIPSVVEVFVRDALCDVLSADSVLFVDTRFVGLGDSALLFEVRADIGAGHGPDFRKMQKYINCAVASACLENGWDIPFPQLVVHKG